MNRVDSYGSGRLSRPIRTCVGCRERSDYAELLRVVVDQREGQFALIPDPHHQAPGRGAHVHPRSECLDLADRRRAFARALRVQAALDLAVIREWLGDNVVSIAVVRNGVVSNSAKREAPVSHEMSDYPPEEFGAGK